MVKIISGYAGCPKKNTESQPFIVKFLAHRLINFVYGVLFEPPHLGFPRDRDHPVGSPGPVGKRDGKWGSGPVPGVPSGRDQSCYFPSRPFPTVPEPSVKPK